MKPGDIVIDRLTKKEVMIVRDKVVTSNPKEKDWYEVRDKNGLLQSRRGFELELEDTRKPIPKNI